MSRILITGGFGYVGGRLTRRLSQEHEVWASSRQQVTEEVLRIHGNPRCIDHALLLIPETFPAFIDTVIHLAALNEIDSVKFPSEAIRVNIDETRIILDNAASREVKHFIYFSTAHIYGSPLIGTINETSLPVPTHPYSITHRAAEDYIVAAANKKILRATILRLSNAFGAPVWSNVNRWTLFVNDLCRQAVEKETMALKSNGCQFRDFICLSDVEEVILSMLKNREGIKNIIYNVGSGIGIRIIEMAELIRLTASKVLNKRIKLELPFGSKPSDEPALNFTIERLLSEGIHISNNVTEELENLIQFCADNFNGKLK